MNKFIKNFLRKLSAKEILTKTENFKMEDLFDKDFSKNGDSEALVLITPKQVIKVLTEKDGDTMYFPEDIFELIYNDFEGFDSDNIDWAFWYEEDINQHNIAISLYHYNNDIYRKHSYHFEILNFPEFVNNFQLEKLMELNNELKTIKDVVFINYECFVPDDVLNSQYNCIDKLLEYLNVVDNVDASDTPLLDIASKPKTLVKR